jgi:hypothetical protein
MLNFFICMIMSVLIGSGMAIVLVEKGNDWPIKPIHVRIQWFQSKIHSKLPQMLFCSTCTSFWTTLISDLIIFIIAMLHGVYYFLWPFSGFISAGIVWCIIEHLNALEKQQNINLVIGDSDNKGDTNE